MIFQAYAVKDNLVNKFFSPIYCSSDDEAKRDFTYKMNTIEQWKFSSSDYSLYRLGTFDDETGTFTSNVEMIANGRSAVKDD